MGGAHNGEISGVECCDRGDAQASGDGDDCRVDEAEPEVGVGVDAATPVGKGEINDSEVFASDESEKRSFGCGPEVAFDLP